MKRLLLLSTGAVTALALCPAVLMTATAATASAATPTSVSRCGTVKAGYATCFARSVVTSVSSASAQSSTKSSAKAVSPSGLSALDIRAAYALSATAGAGRTVAIVDAYDDPSAANDLAVYRAAFKLPACTVSNGCFRKVNQTGGSALPKVDAGWAGETSLDIEMVSAACPACKILLVEASTSSVANLAAAVNYAATQHVSAISNSYGSSDLSHASAYNHPGIAVVAAVGDSGYGSGAPAAFSTVVAVGGTTLHKALSGRGWTESAWSGGGSLCASGISKPAWQSAATKCAGKAVSDVSAVADPNTGVAVYAGTKYEGWSGWQVFGGTSVAAPIIAGVYAQSGHTAGYPAAYTWAYVSAHPGSLNDVTTGSNGSCRTAVWCKAAKGWDGPTGLGTPKGSSAF